MTTSDRAPESHGGGSRHVSIRVPIELYEGLEALASEHNESVSQTARRLIGAGVTPGGRNTIDEAITTLIAIRDRIPASVVSTGMAEQHAAPAERPTPKRIDILNAKTDLQRLIVDVAHGAEFVITHAGAPRARLVSVDEAPDH